MATCYMPLGCFWLINQSQPCSRQVGSCLSKWQCATSYCFTNAQVVFTSGWEVCSSVWRKVDWAACCTSRDMVEFDVGIVMKAEVGGSNEDTRAVVALAASSTESMFATILERWVKWKGCNFLFLTQAAIPHPLLWCCSVKLLSSELLLETHSQIHSQISSACNGSH